MAIPPRPPGPIGPGPFPDQPLRGTSSSAEGVSGLSNFGVGVSGLSLGQPGAQGAPPATDGVLGNGKNGVHGISYSATDSGVWGENKGAGYGVSGSTNSTFVVGADGKAGVWGHNFGSGMGVKGTSSGGDGVLGYSNVVGHAGVSANNSGGGNNSYGLYASGTPAGHFEGDVEVTGDVRLTNQDCAEDFDISDVEEVEPGTVMVIETGDVLRISAQAYDKRVAGVVSGAGDLRPGIILGRQRSLEKRRPIALLGRVSCKVDAQYAAIEVGDLLTFEVGDLLTSSPTPGHAMKAQDPLKAFGAVIGKALRPFADGKGLIPILIALQ